MLKIKIEKNWKPAPRYGVEPSKIVLPFKSLNVGESFFVPVNELSVGKLQHALNMYRIKNRQRRKNPDSPWISMHIQTKKVGNKNVVTGARIYKAR